jgi:D-alanine transaminase
METLANLNGRIMPLKEVMVPALDRGFLFGDAVYEGIRVSKGQICLAEEHFGRLARSLEAIRIAGVDLARLRRRLEETIAAGPFVEAFAYLQVTRGAGPRRTHEFPPDAVPTEFLFVEEFRDPYVEKRVTGAAAITYPDLRWERCDIKSVNILANSLAAQAAKEAGVVEAILTLPDGTLTEGSRTSVFGVLGGVLRTAPASPAILPGVTRGVILRLARQLGLPVEERALQKSEVSSLSELFLTGTTTEVLPIIRLDGVKVGDGRPGPISRRLHEAYRAAARPG